MISENDTNIKFNSCATQKMKGGIPSPFQGKECLQFAGEQGRYSIHGPFKTEVTTRCHIRLTFAPAGPTRLGAGLGQILLADLDDFAGTGLDEGLGILPF